MVILLAARIVISVSLLMALTLQVATAAGALKSPLIEEEHNPEDSNNIGKSRDVGEIIQVDNLKSKRQLRGKERPQTNVTSGSLTDGTMPAVNGTYGTVTSYSDAVDIMADVGNSNVNIMSMMNGKCIDSNDRTAKPLIMYDCHGWESNANQIFYRPGSTGPIQLYGKNLCLDAYGRTVGATVGLWTCHGGDNQKWWYYSASMTLRPSFNANLCLDIKYADGCSGASLQLWNCNGGKNQQWSSYGSAQCASSYFPVSGDTCNRIGTKFGVSGSAIITANPFINSGCTNLKVGEVICIPSSGTVGNW